MGLFNKKASLVLSIVIILSLICVFLFFGFGMVFASDHSEDLNLDVIESTQYNWILQNPGELNSLRLNGINSGITSAYIENNNETYLIFSFNNSDETNFELCEETCNLTDFNKDSYNIIFNIEGNSSLIINKIIYSIKDKNITIQDNQTIVNETETSFNLLVINETIEEELSSEELTNENFELPIETDKSEFTIPTDISKSGDKSNGKDSIKEITNVSKLILVKSTKEERNKAEIREIEKPKKPYSLEFVSESLTPINKVGKKIKEKKNKYLSNKKGKDHTYGFIMISGLIDEEKLNTLTDYGVKLLGYHSHHSYKAKIPFNKVDDIENLPFIKWMGYSTEKQKLHTNLFNTIKFSKDKEIGVYINLFEDDRNGEFKDILEQKGVKIYNYSKSLMFYSASASPQILEEIINLDFILFIEKKPKIDSFHDESTPSIGADYVRGSSSSDGSGISIGIIDSGYNSNHADLPAYKSCLIYTSDGDCEDNTGHGTHIAGTILGRGNAESKYKGVAPGINGNDIIIAKVTEEDGSIDSDDFKDAIRWMGRNEADVVSISLGADISECKGTDVHSRKADNAVYLHDKVLVVAAGNDGPTSYSLRSPGCAKNVITVGAIYDYGEDNIDHIWSDSSRGPTDDGRRKPDVVASGCRINSTDWENNDGYISHCGTSMATPHVSGLVATLLDHYSWLENDPEEVKALLTSKTLMHNGESSGVDNTYGMGKVDSYLSHWDYSGADGWTSSVGSSYLIEDEDWAYMDISVPSDADRLVVVLTWNEPSASAGASYAVINDLDLYVDREADDPGGNTGEYSSTWAYDNKEYVIIDGPGDYTFRLKVYAYNIDPDNSPQRFSIAYLIVRGDPTPTATTVAAAADDYSVFSDEEVEITATVTPSSFIASGVYTEIEITSGVDVLSMETTREDGVTMTYDGDYRNINLGNIHVDDTRSVTWTVRPTTTGIKRIYTNIDSDNAGTDSDYVDINVSSPPENNCSNLIDDDTDSSTDCDDSDCIGKTGPNGGICCDSNAGNCPGIALCHSCGADDECNFNSTTTICNSTYMCSHSAGGDNAYITYDFKNPSRGYCDGAGYCDYGASSPTCNYSKGNEGTLVTSVCRDNNSTCQNSCYDSIDNDNDGFIDSADSDCDEDDSPIVTLVKPPNYDISITGDIEFNCSASDDFKLVNITLYTNIDGTWKSNQTSTLNGTFDSTVFTINDLLNNTNFIWNCLAYDNNTQPDWSDVNYTVNVSIPSNTAPTTPIIIHPNGNETLGGYITINWTQSVDSEGNNLLYNLQYSNNSGVSWYNIISNYGYENKLNDSSVEKTLTFNESYNKTVYIRIPKKAVVTKTNFKINGWSV